MFAICSICNKQVNVCLLPKERKGFSNTICVLTTSCDWKYSFYSSPELNIDKGG